MKKRELLNIESDGKKIVKVEVVNNETGEIHIGVAKCADGDTFDLETGVSIAKERAMISSAETELTDTKYLMVKLAKEYKKAMEMLEKKADGLVMEINNRSDNLEDYLLYV